MIVRSINPLSDVIDVINKLHKAMQNNVRTSIYGGDLVWKSNSTFETLTLIWSYPAFELDDRPVDLRKCDFPYMIQ